jgi:hypothetical protein
MRGEGKRFVGGGQECPIKAVNNVSENRTASIASVQSHVIFISEDGSNTFLRNVYVYLPNYTPLYSRKSNLHFF